VSEVQPLYYQRAAGRLKEALEALEKAEVLAERQALDPSLLFIAMGRIYACLHKYKKAAEFSGKARLGFLKLWSQKFSMRQKSVIHNSHSQSKSESAVEYDEESEIYRQLSIACYTHGSHLDKLGNHADGVKYLVEARDYHEKILTLLPKDYEFYHTIETKIEHLREKLNNFTTFAENESLIKSRADQNLSKLNFNSPADKDLKTLPLVYSKLDLRENKQIEEALHTNSQKLRPVTASSSSSKFTSKTGVNKSTAEQDRVYRILKKTELPAKYGEVAKDPDARKNVDSMSFRVSPLYMHDEYFHGNYDKGIEMFKSTSNNEKFYPYKALNPIPNDKAYTYNTRPTAKKPFPLMRRQQKQGGLANQQSTQTFRVHGDTVDVVQGTGGADESFDSQPDEVIDLAWSGQAGSRQQPKQSASKGMDQPPMHGSGVVDNQKPAQLHEHGLTADDKANKPPEQAANDYAQMLRERLQEQSHNMSHLDEADEF
jgi:hypothetical protein